MYSFWNTLLFGGAALEFAGVVGSRRSCGTGTQPMTTLYAIHLIRRIYMTVTWSLSGEYLVRIFFSGDFTWTKVLKDIRAGVSSIYEVLCVQTQNREFWTTSGPGIDYSASPAMERSTAQGYLNCASLAFVPTIQHDPLALTMEL
jgi:hypothetical protein